MNNNNYNNYQQDKNIKTFNNININLNSNNINNKTNNNTFQPTENYGNEWFNKNNHDFTNKFEIKGENSSKDFKTIKSIIKKCESLYNTAQVNYENFKIKKSFATLEKVNSTLISIKLTITTQKKELSSFIPQKENLENLSTTTLNNYRINIYESISRKFKSIN